MRGETDVVLIRRIRDGCHDSFRILLERYWSLLVNYANSIVADRDAAEDLVQEVFVRVWKQRAEWEELGTVSAYLYRITRNLSLNEKRSTKVAHASIARAAIGGGSVVSNMDPHQLLVAKDLAHEVEVAIEALPLRRREVFVLSRFHRLSHSEIAETMGISPQTVSNQMSSALKGLREALSAFTS